MCTSTNPADMPLALIVGAGPSGLCVANLLQSFGRKFVLIEAQAEFDQFSKATGVHSNTLKLLDKLGLIEEISKKSIVFNGNRIFNEGKLVKEIEFTQGQEPNDKNISISQYSLQKILQGRLKSQIQFNSRLVDFEQTDESVTAVVEKASQGRFSIKAKYLIACDGAKSIVRHQLNIPFEGETSPEWSFTFDAKVLTKLDSDKMYMYTKDNALLVMVPLPQGFKFSGRVSTEWHAKLSEADATERCTLLARLVFERSALELDAKTIQGFSLFHLAARIASTMRDKRIFLVGDAAHVCYPNKGYGLNTAIEDAFSLAWRLVAAENNSVDNILEAFNRERLENARQIQADSTQQKKSDDNLKTDAKALEKQKEEQIYSQSQGVLVRLESVLPVDVCKSIQSNRQTKLSEVFHTNPGFTVIVNTKIKENRSQTQQTLKEALGLSVKWVYTTTVPSDEEEYYDISRANCSLFKEHPESIILIRPDNFLKIVHIRHVDN